MHKNILLAVGITILFLGLVVQPVFAVNPISSDKEEACNICPKISKLQGVEKYQELFDRITKLKEMNKEIKPDYPYPIICNILYLYMMGFHSIKYALFDSIREILPNKLSDFLFWLYVLRNTPFFIALFLYIFEFDCEDFELPDW